VLSEGEKRIRFKRSSQLRMELLRLRRHRPAMIGLGITLLVLLVAIFAPVIAPHPYDEQNLQRMFEGPSRDYPLGTDAVGRCVFSRIVYGSRIAFLVGIVVVSIEAGIGITLGNLVLATLTFPSALLTASAMSFLGFGAQPPTPDWGALLNEGREYLRSAPWISTFPGLAILITVLGFNFLGDGLRDAFDPRLKL